MSMVCIAMMSGPVKHSTYWSISGSEQYWNNTGSCWRRERKGGEVHSEPKALELGATIPESAVSW